MTIITGTDFSETNRLILLRTGVLGLHGTYNIIVIAQNWKYLTNDQTIQIKHLKFHSSVFC